jgi:large subunit ribosomal protein L18
MKKKILSTRERLRKRRHVAIRRKVQGTPERPRVSVFRSNREIYAQIIDDVHGRTMVSASTLEKSAREQLAAAGNRVEAGKLIGKMLAEKARAQDIHEVVFDRGGYAYHGRVKALAEGAREGGLKF